MDAQIAFEDIIIRFVGASRSYPADFAALTPTE
jgi:hypothetical protein